MITADDLVPVITTIPNDCDSILRIIWPEEATMCDLEALSVIKKEIEEQFKGRVYVLLTPAEYSIELLDSPNGSVVNFKLKCGGTTRAEVTDSQHGKPPPTPVPSGGRPQTP